MKRKDVKVENTLIYLSALEESLNQKIEVFQLLFQSTEMQKEQLDNVDLDIDNFNQLTSEKDNLIKRIEDLDKTFENLYERIYEDLVSDKDNYREQIVNLQDMIKMITSIGVKIKAIEQQNKVKLDYFIRSKRNDIKNFKVQSNTALKYHSNMADQHKGQSYFYDKKK